MCWSIWCGLEYLVCVDGEGMQGSRSIPITIVVKYGFVDCQGQLVFNTVGDWEQCSCLRRSVLESEERLGSRWTQRRNTLQFNKFVGGEIE